MFNWKAENQILLDEQVGGKGRRFETRFLQAGLVKYSFGVCLLEKETIDKFIYNFVGCPVIINHKDVTNQSAKDDRVGVISRVWFNERDGWYWGEGVIFDQEALNLIDKGYNVSCQYEITEYSSTGGLHNGNNYDKTILNGKPEHLAIVQNPRYENAMIAVNAIDQDSDFVTLTKKDGSKYVCNLAKSNDNIKDFRTYKNFLNVQKIKQSNNKEMVANIDSVLEEIASEVEYEYSMEEKQREELSNTSGAKGIRTQLGVIFDDNFTIDMSNDGYRWNVYKKDNGLTHKSAIWYSNLVCKKYPHLRAKPKFANITIKNKMMYYIDITVIGANELKQDNIKKAINDLKEEIMQAINEEGRWITVKGTHVFVKKGQSVEDALREKSGDEKSNLQGKYEREDVEFDEEQLKKDIKAAKDMGHESVEDIAEFLGLDEDEVRETTSDKPANRPKFDDKGFAKFVEENRKKRESAKNDIIQAINDIKGLDMFKNLFKKKEKNMDREEIKDIMMECLTELTASNEAEKKDEPDYKKMYEDLKAENEKAKKEAEEKEKEKEVEKEEAGNKCDKAKNSIEQQKEAMMSPKVEVKSTYITQIKARELGRELF